MLVLYGLEGVCQTIVSRSSYEFRLPTYSGYQSSFSYVDKDADEMLRVKSGGRVIEVYDMKSGHLKQEVSVEVTFEIGVFSRTKNGYFWVFDPYARKLSFHDPKGKTIRIFDELESAHVPAVYTSYYADLNYNPLIISDEKIIFASGLLSVSGKEHDLKTLNNLGFLRVFDIKGKKFYWKGKLPPSLIKNDYGFLNRFSSTKKGDSLIIAPFFSNEIMVLNTKSGEFVFSNLSNNRFKYVTEPFSPVMKKPKSLGDSQGEQHYRKNSHYIAIIYDKYRKVYYRILLSPTAKFNKKQITVVTLNESFKYMSSHQLSLDYNHNGLFVTKEGLNILNHAKYIENPNLLSYDTFIFE